MKKLMFFAIVVLLASGTSAQAQIILSKAVVAAGGNLASNATSRVNATAGQAVIGVTSSPQVQAQLGFWTAEKSSAGVAIAAIPSSIAINAWPNPASGLTKIDVTTQPSSELDVRLFDLAGREVKTLFTGPSSTASQTFSVNLSDLPSGTYIIAARVPGELVQKAISVMH